MTRCLCGYRKKDGKIVSLVEFVYLMPPSCFRIQCLSDIVENYFKAIKKEEGDVKSESTSITDSLRGSFKAPKCFDYKKELTRALSGKCQ
jgi:hypothetical protein